MKWIDVGNPFKMIGAGFIIGLTNGIVTTLIQFTFFGHMPTYEGTQMTYQAFLAITNNPVIASVLEHMLTELSDKTVSIFIAATVYTYLPKQFKLWGGRK